MTTLLFLAMCSGALGGTLAVLLSRVLPCLVTWARTRWRLRGGFVSVRDGSWNDPATWSGRRVPGDGARVVLRHRVLAPRVGARTRGLRVFADADGCLV